MKGQQRRTNELLEKALEQLAQQRPLMLAAILSSEGSSPRGKGAAMLCGPDGLLCGSVGGGSLEERCIALSREFLASSHSCVMEFTLGKASSQLPDMLCGGSVRIAFVCLSADPGRWAAALQQALQTLERREDAVLDLNDFGQLAIPALTQVYVFGGGHCAFALVPILARIGFRVCVVDDRSAFADPQRFPDAEKVLCCPYSQISEHIRLTEDDYAVVMTSGHTHDLEVLEQILKGPFAYLGCMGSRGKAAALNARLLEKGFDPQTVGRVLTPIGLAIGSQTPEEIAVSIAAQLISFRAQKRKEKETLQR